MPKGEYKQNVRKDNIEKTKKWIKEAGGKNKMNMDSIIKKCMDELGCTRRRALEYIDVATS